MGAKLKCSNCGEEVSSLRFSRSSKEWLWFILPAIIMLIFYWGFNTILRGGDQDFMEELKITQLSQHYSHDTLSFIGVVENTGDTTWSHIQIEVEFFDAEGQFLDEYSSYLTGTLQPLSSENFKIAIKEVSPKKASSLEDFRFKVAAASSW